MKAATRILIFLCAMAGSVLLLSSFLYTNARRLRFPYKHAGLTERQAAAHLLSRFTYGATPGQIDAVVKQGLENWFQQQLDANLADDSLNTLLNQYPDLKLSNSEMANTFLNNGLVLKMAIKDSVINKDSVKNIDRKDYKELLQGYMAKKGLKPEQELYRQFINQKILRAAYSNNQLQEVMTDFWFNHFNVSITKNDCARFIPDYERDVIRPNALGKFDQLLLGTAKSPAMLYYLDNFSSSGQAINGRKANEALRARLLMNAPIDSAQRVILTKRLNQASKAAGLNENYAREVMELHTLGVDGGYTQQDVTQAARVLTGWTVYPMGENAQQAINNLLGKFTPEQLAAHGFVHEGDFMFNPNRHDTTTKVVLGHQFTDKGYQEGVDLLEMLAHHPSTAKFVSRKLAVRFVSDNPPQSLIDKMARTFTESGGDIKEVLITMVSAPEFWSSDAVRQKVKSPFELTIDAVRNLNATITQPYQLYNWINKMGEKKYYYVAPTGFPDKGQYWINTGSLLSRMNFGLAFASGKIPGVKIDLSALNNHHEPESTQAALVTYAKIIMPERDLDATIKRLTPMLNDPQLTTKVVAASAQTQPLIVPGQVAMGRDTIKKTITRPTVLAMQNNNNTMLAQVVGVIIGSPEYQRR